MQKKLFILACGCVLLLSGCQTKEQPQIQTSTTASAASSANSAPLSDTESQSIELFAMDTVMNLMAYGSHAEAALTAAQNEIERLDALFSISSASGDIMPLNQNHTGEVSDDTKTLVQRALEISDATGGLFDCTIEPVMRAWGFPSQKYRVPSPTELQELLAHVDYHQVQLSGNTVTIPYNVQIDLGGIAKGYASARVMDVFAENGVKSGIISLGGNVQALGLKPDGSRWRVGIQNPDNEEDTFAMVQIENEAVITSGGYQRYFDQNGTRYHHIIDPRTGYPADSGIISSTIVSKDGTLADGLSTSLFIMGLDEASDFWRKNQDNFDAILMTSDHQVYVTKGIADRFSRTDGGDFSVIS